LPNEKLQIISRERIHVGSFLTPILLLVEENLSTRYSSSGTGRTFAASARGTSTISAGSS
jgi:hypothetical protein